MTADQLRPIIRKMFNFDPKTGLFTRATNVRGRKIGDIAGYINPQGYRVIMVDGKPYQAARLVYLWMTGSWPKDEIDHINRDPSDNRWSNLRDATRTQNRWNVTVRKDSLTKLKGVHFHKGRQMYQAKIKINKKEISLGFFDDAEAAHSAYCEAAIHAFGRFARAS